MRKSFPFIASVSLIIMGMSSMGYADQVSPRHGYVANPPSRAFLCSRDGGNLNKNCGSVQYEPQSLEATKGFPEKGPADGKIASAGHEKFSELNEQTASRWHKVTLTTGKHDFTWMLTAPHKTEKWRFFITKNHWNPDEKLTRAQFDLTRSVCKQDDNGALPAKTVTIKGCEIPADYSGYHVILGIWDVADTRNAFYQVMDVNIVKP